MGMGPREMVGAVIRNMKAKTGKSLEEWVRIAAKGPGPRQARIDWLKRTHDLGHVTATIVADRVEGRGMSVGYDDPEALVRALYAGPKAKLRPIHDELVRLARKLGKDVTVNPCKTYVAVERHRQFAVIKPGGRDAVDLGLALPDVPPQGRLQAVRKMGGSDRITRRIRAASLAEVDDEVRRWLQAAYQGDR
jgi:hypothetical protein